MSLCRCVTRCSFVNITNDVVDYLRVQKIRPIVVTLWISTWRATGKGCAATHFRINRSVAPEYLWERPSPHMFFCEKLSFISPMERSAHPSKRSIFKFEQINQ